MMTASYTQGYFCICADAQREAFVRISQLKGAGSKTAAAVFGWLQGQVVDGEGWTRALSYSDAEKELAASRQRVSEAVACLRRSGLILAAGEPDDYGRRTYQLYGGVYRSLCAETEPPPVRLPHAPSEQDTETAQEGVWFPHTPSSETEHWRKLLRAFGVTSPKALDEIITVMRRYWRGLDWLLGWMIEYQLNNADGWGCPRQPQDEMIDLFVAQVCNGSDEPPSRSFALAQETLAGLESERDFTEVMLRERMAGISQLTSWRAR